MARFTKLSTELLLNIGSYVHRSSHALNFVLINRKTSRLISDVLYKDIVLSDFKGPQAPEPSPWAVSENLRRLVDKIKTTPALGLLVRSVEVAVACNRRCPTLELWVLMQHTPSLKAFNLTTNPPYPASYPWGDPTFWPDELAPVLYNVQHTVERLTINVEFGRNDNTHMSFLKEFPALKFLSIKSHILLGSYPFGEAGVKGLIDLAPIGLEELHLQCGADKGEEDDQEKNEQFRSRFNWVMASIVDWLAKEPRQLPKLRIVNVLLIFHGLGCLRPLRDMYNTMKRITILARSLKIEIKFLCDLGPGLGIASIDA